MDVQGGDQEDREKGEEEQEDEEYEEEDEEDDEEKQRRNIDFTTSHSYTDKNKPTTSVGEDWSTEINTNLQLCKVILHHWESWASLPFPLHAQLYTHFSLLLTEAGHIAFSDYFPLLYESPVQTQCFPPYFPSSNSDSVCINLLFKFIIHLHPFLYVIIL